MKDCLTCLIYLAVIGMGSFCLGRHIPYEKIREGEFPFASFAWEEEGRCYERLHIKNWQNKVPDMSALFPHRMPAKRLFSCPDDQQITVMIKETCIAEIIHILLALQGLHCRRIWKGTGGAILSLLFLLGNLPYILIQRYNRPRLARLYRHSICARRRQAP